MMKMIMPIASPATVSVSQVLGEPISGSVTSQRAAVGQPELAVAPAPISPRVGARRHAEELGLQQRIGNSGDVDADERPAGPARCRMDGMRQQLLAGPGFAEQQHRAQRLRGPARLALDLHCRSAAADEAGEGVFGAAPATGLLQPRAPALHRQLAARVVQVPLQQCELADQGLQGGFRMVKQHDADGADDLLRFVAQGNAADYKGSGAVGQQVDQHRLAGFQYAPHLGVGNHFLHHAAHELLHRTESQIGQEATVAFVDPDDAAGPVHQEHALADTGKKLEHGTRGKRQDAVGIQGQHRRIFGGLGHGAMVAPGPG